MQIHNKLHNKMCKINTLKQKINTKQTQDKINSKASTLHRDKKNTLRYTGAFIIKHHSAET